MSIEVRQNVIDVTVNVRQNGLAISLQPVIVRNGGGGGGSVNSVFGRIGNVTSQNGDYTTAQVTQATNKNYVTDDELALIPKDVIGIYMSAATGELTAGDKASVAAPYDFILNTFWIWVEIPPTEQSLVADFKKAGVSVTTTKAAIDADENSSLTGTEPVLTGNLNFLKGSLLTPVLVQTGAIETGQNLIMYLEVTKI